jgi:hypothetical protein
MADKSNGERLDALLQKHAPKAVAYHEQHKQWSGDPEGPSPEELRKALTEKLMKNDNLPMEEAKIRAAAAVASRGVAPYVIKTARDNAKRVLITKDDGSVIAGSGPTTADAITQLEAL